MENDSRYHEHAALSLACSALIGAAARRYGNVAADFDHRQLLCFLENALGDVPAPRLRRGRAKMSSGDIPASGPAPSGESLRFNESLANAGILWLVSNRFPGYERARFTDVLFEDSVEEGIEIYESAFGKIRSDDYDWLRSFQYAEAPNESSYPIFDHVTSSTYPAACMAWKAFKQHKEICAVAKLPWEVAKLQAPDALCVLTGGAIDMSDAWEGDLVDYTLACELFDALFVFYADVIERDKHAFSVPGADDAHGVERLAEAYDMDLKVGCFLDGVPATDIVA